MTFGKALMVAGLGMMLCASQLGADPMRKTVKMTFSTPVRLPGATLPAGTYLFSHAEANQPYQAIKVRNAEGRAILLFKSHPVRRSPVDGVKVELTDQGQGMAPALKAFFYPGEEFGAMPVFEKGNGPLNAGAAATSIAD